jgi:hypothetical protein
VLEHGPALTELSDTAGRIAKAGASVPSMSLAAS